MRIIIVGGGWSGCAAAIAARNYGAEALLLERTDMLLGTGLVGGIMRNNGRFTATEEMIALGGGELFALTDANSLHRGVDFPGHAHASLYSVASMESVVRSFLRSIGVDLRFRARVDAVEKRGDRLVSVAAKVDGASASFEGDAFVDATGTAGPMNLCARYGNGCAMCVLRCPSFGGRVSLTGLAGVPETMGRKGDHIGAMSGSCKLLKESLSADIVRSLDQTGVAVVPIPKGAKGAADISTKACQQYALPEFHDNIVLLDTGHAKLMTPFYPLETLRLVPGFENARYEDPYSGGIGNSMRYLGMSPRDDALKVDGIANLFCGGEKAGLLVGHTEAIATGTLAGHNACRAVAGEAPLVLPRTLSVGDAIAHVGERMRTEEGLAYKYTFSGSVYLERMKKLGLYTVDVDAIRARVSDAGLTGVFAKK